MGDAKWTKEQELVINLCGRNILVSAAAGSGKTAVLVERIIQIISDRSRRVDIDRLLVVTFTKAAASEMRSRVGDAIEGMLLECPDDEHLQRQATLLHNAQITTIDSFCQNIIRNYFHVIDLDPSFRVADENELAIMKTDIMEELLFLDFTESFSPGRTDSNIEELVLRLYNISVSYPWPEEWLGSCLDMYSCSSMEEFEETLWMKELKKYIDNSLNDYLAAANRALEICNSESGPGNYCDAIESDINQIMMVKEADSYASYYNAFCMLNPARLSAKRDPNVIPEKKEEVKKAPVKKTPVKKAAAKKEVKVKAVVEYYGKQVDEKDIIANVKKAWTKSGRKVGDIKTIDLYIKPEEGAVYYVINGSDTGAVAF